MTNVTPILIAFLGGFGLTLWATPRVMKLAVHAGALDKPDHRKIHSKPMPLWGGLGVSLSATIAFLTALYASGLAMSPRQIDGVIAIVLCSLLIVGVGMVDDRFGMAAKVKLMAQIGLSLILVGAGVRIDFFSLPLVSGVVYLSEWQCIALSMLWLVGVTNAVNLLDGLDGLVSGVACGSALILAVVAALNGQWLPVLAMAALAGATLGFLRFNFNPAQLFMGDTGSLWLGLMFASWSLLGYLKTTATVTLTVPILLVMAVPLLDTSFAIIRRGWARQPIFKPDKGHLHHRLLSTGMSQKQAVITIYAINTAFGLAGLALACVVK